MKATELRIGNWVEYQGQHFKMYGINHDIPFLDTIEFGDGVVEWKDIKPIPLTEEWLLRFGAVSDVVSSMFGLNWIAINLSTDGDFWIENVTGEVVIIKYVHQLQNLYFALTGKELQVK